MTEAGGQIGMVETVTTCLSSSHHQSPISEN
jgi:hypothetical protein